MKRRGSAFVTVVAVLALLCILMEIALQLLVSHVSESRRRGDAAYAGELARSGLEWARACIAAGSPCDGRREVAGGVIEIAATQDGEWLDVTSKGRVLRGGAPGPARIATTRIRKAGAGAEGSGEPPAPRVEPKPPEPKHDGPQPKSPDPATAERSSEEFPRYF